MALDLYQGCYNSEFYGSYGFFGQPDFRIFAGKLGIQPIRVQRLLTQMLISRTEVIALIENSFLPDEQKRTYIGKYEERLRRLGMTEQMIAAVINPKYPGVYAPTSKPVVLTFMNHSVVAGFFETTPDSEKLKQENKYTFATAADARQYQKNRADNLITIIDADELIKVQFAEDH
jgi:hypothetical protein